MDPLQIRTVESLPPIGTETSISPSITVGPDVSVVIVRPTFTFVELPKKTAPKPPGENLNTAQAAALAGKTAATIRRWAKLKLITLADLPGREGKPARIYSIPTEPFKRWLKDHHINVSPEGPLGKAAL
jgi:hypothetical protein